MIRIAFLAITLLAGCKTRNELSCEAPENMALDECNGIDAQERCAGPGECSVGVCKLPDGVCVGCVANTDCMAADEPICNQTTNSCEACNAHADCPANACNLDTGECIDETTVAYVSKTGTGTTCGKADPCGDLNTAIAADKPVIRVLGTQVISVPVAQGIDRDVTIFADVGAGFTRSTAGPILTITNPHTITIEDLEVSGGLGSGGDAINNTPSGTKLTLVRVFLLSNDGRGVIAAAGDTLTMQRCILAANAQGGVVVSDLKLDVTNSIIVGNGAPTSAVGGFRITNANPASVFQFNTIADNADNAPAVTSGVNCDATAFPASNNIVTGNALATTCTFKFSLFDNSTPVLPAGTMNKSGDPKFESTDIAKVRETKYYRIKDGSSAIDQADPAATQPIDIDGDPRPNGTARDVGADEH